MIAAAPGIAFMFQEVGKDMRQGQGKVSQLSQPSLKAPGLLPNDFRLHLIGFPYIMSPQHRGCGIGKQDYHDCFYLTL